MTRNKKRVILVGNACVALWVVSIISGRLWFTAIVALIIGILILKYQKLITTTVVSNEGNLAKNIPSTVTLQRKGYEFALPFMGWGFIFFGILLLLQML